MLAMLQAAATGCEPASAPGAKTEPTEAVASPPAASTPGEAPTPATESPARPPEAVPEPPAADDVADAPVTPPAEIPIGLRRATRPMMVYVEPRLGTPFRGKIQLGEVFELYERVPGEDCRGEGWGRVGPAAYVCLHRSEPTEDEATALPRRLVDDLAPFFYARLRPKDASGENPPAPRHRSRAAMRRGAPPESFLEPEHDYAFVSRRRFRGGAVLYTHDHRVVAERDVKRMVPSDFRGRDMRAKPVPDGARMSWSITWPYATVRTEARSDAEELHRLRLHDQLLVRDEPVTHRGESWLPVVEPVDGWVLADEIRWWVPMDPPPEIAPDQVWLDVDLDQQMLALRRGAAVTFLTLVSSGNWKHGTPVGLFRIEGKWAFADMRSRAGDDDTYHVEGVPWVLYFRGRYALHGTFWHNRFGRRTSHGCVNLSAHDARYVYERTSPTALPGFVTTHEHAVDPGTLLRIRKGTAAPPDRRGPPVGTEGGTKVPIVEPR